MVKILPSSAEGAGSIPGQGAKIPHTLGPKNQNIKQKQYCNKFSLNFKMIHIKKTILKKKSKAGGVMLSDFKLYYKANQKSIVWA